MLVSKIDIDRVNMVDLCKKGFLKGVRYCLKQGVEVNEDAIYVAAYKGHLEIVRELIKYNAPVNAWAIYWAALKGHLEIVKELIAYNAPVSEVLREYVSKQN